MNALFKKHFFSWILPSLILLGAASIYFSDVVFGDKQIAQDDILMGLAKGREIVEYRAQHDSEPLWTNSMFSGMPTFQISTEYPNNIFSYVQGLLTNLLIENSGIYIIVTLMLGFFALLRSEGVRTELAILGALAFGFSAFFIISLAAGHNAKIRTAAYMAPLLMGVLLTLRGRLWLGFALTAFFTGMSIHANHFQITFYTAIPVLAMVVAFGVAAFRAKKIGSWAKQVGLLGAAALIGMGPNLGNLWSSYAYTQESMRGGHSALVEGGEEKSQGLDFDYAMSWSYGIGETVNLFIPNATGGGSKQSYEDTKTYETAKRFGIPKEQVNQYVGSVLYSGDQSMVNGAYYVGAIVVFFFVIGLMLVRGPLLWGSIGAMSLAILMAWGKNAAWFNEILFNHLPLYNKFRVPSMSLVVVFLIVPLIGFKGLELLLQRERKEAAKLLLRAFQITGGFALVIWLIGGSLLGLEGANDSQWTGMGFKLDEMLNDRADLLSSSARTTLLFVFLAGAAIWLHLNNRIKIKALTLILGGLLALDLWGFDKDQLGEEDLMDSKRVEAITTELSPADKEIKKDKDPHYRVYDRTTSLTGDGETPAFHNSISGYHGAKLARYQDLIDVQLSRQIPNEAVINMLNAKYTLVNQSDDRGNRKTDQVIPNSSACGHAWFPHEVQFVDRPSAAMEALGHSVYLGKVKEAYAYEFQLDRSLDSTVWMSVQNSYLQVFRREMSDPNGKPGPYGLISIDYLLGGKGPNGMIQPQSGNPEWKNGDSVVAHVTFNPLLTAIYEADMVSESEKAEWAQKFVKPNSTGPTPTIELTSYAPNKMVYNVSNLTQDQVAVFSEIYYQAPNQGWTATADGKPLEIKRANYILRSALIPAGTKEVVFTFEPETYYLGEKLDLAFSILLLLSVGGAVFVESKKGLFKMREESKS